MKKTAVLIAVVILILSIASCKKSDPEQEYLEKVVKTHNLKDGVYSVIKTSKGDIICEMYYKRVPLTVSNFVGLAEGKILNKVKEAGVPYFDGLTFHRVVKNFVIQGGDPFGNGSGGPGYSFKDEFHPELKHDSAGILSMANSGPATNGSQFFITFRATPHLNNKHSVFGKVVSGMDTVNSIEQGDKIYGVKILRVGENAKAFQPDEKSFRAEIEAQEKAEKEQAASKLKAAEKIVKERWPDAITEESGLKYIIVQEGKGDTPKAGDVVETHYTVKLLDGTKIDSSLDRNSTLKFRVGKGQVIKAWDEALLAMKRGEKRILIVPPALGYGKRGKGPVPPYATLHFEVEMVDFAPPEQAQPKTEKKEVKK